MDAIGRFWSKRFGESPGPIPRPVAPSEPLTPTAPASKPPASAVGSQAVGRLTGSLSGLSAEEQDIAGELLNQGRNVEIIPTGQGRTPDFKVDGTPTELKTLSGVANQTSDGLSSALSSRIMDARGQATMVIVNARNQPGMTREIARRGIDRAIGADKRSGERIQSITVLTPDGVASFKRQ